MNTYIFAMLGFFPVVVFVVGYAFFNRKPKNGPTQTRGTKPSQDSALVVGGTGGAHAGGGHISAITIPRDPQKYAKAMMPKTKPRKK